MLHEPGPKLEIKCSCDHGRGPSPRAGGYPRYDRQFLVRSGSIPARGGLPAHKRQYFSGHGSLPRALASRSEVRSTQSISSSTTANILYADDLQQCFPSCAPPAPLLIAVTAQSLAPALPAPARCTALFRVLTVVAPPPLADGDFPAALRLWREIRAGSASSGRPQVVARLGASGATVTNGGRAPLHGALELIDLDAKRANRLVEILGCIRQSVHILLRQAQSPR